MRRGRDTRESASKFQGEARWGKFVVKFRLEIKKFGSADPGEEREIVLLVIWRGLL